MSSKKIFDSDFELELFDLKQNNKNYGEKNQLIWYFDLCSLSQYSGKFMESNKYCQQADVLAENPLTRSLSESVRGFLTDSNAITYAGKSFEHQLIFALGMINYASLHDPSEALVQSRKLDIATRNNFDREISQEESLGRYLSALLYESEGYIDSALIDSRIAFHGYLQAHKKLGLPFPSMVGHDLLRLLQKMGMHNEYDVYCRKYFLSEPINSINTSMGEVVLIIEAGFAPYKVTEFYSDSGDVEPLGIYKRRAPLIHKVRANLLGENETTAISATKIYDIALTIKHTETASIKRKIDSNGLVLIPNYKFEKYGGELDDFDPVVQHETADVRSWSMLPNSVLLLRMPLPAGEHSIIANYSSYYDEDVYQQKINNISVKENTRTFLFAKLP